MNIPVSWIGMGLKDKSITPYLPNMFIWLGGASCALHLFRQLRHVKNHVFTWFQSFLNGKKYLQPISDKYAGNLTDASPSAGPGLAGDS
jgi:hypothetical protein